MFVLRNNITTGEGINTNTTDVEEDPHFQDNPSTNGLSSTIPCGSTTMSSSSIEGLGGAIKTRRNDSSMYCQRVSLETGATNDTTVSRKTMMDFVDIPLDRPASSRGGTNFLNTTPPVSERPSIRQN